MIVVVKLSVGLPVLENPAGFSCTMNIFHLHSNYLFSVFFLPLGFGL